MVCKMRYDLLRQNMSNKESECFDFYDNVFDLEKGEQVTCMFPFVSTNSQKLIYVTQQNLSDLESIKINGYLPKRIVTMPFLHDRKIFTGVINENQKYFNLTLPKDLYDDRLLVEGMSVELSASMRAGTNTFNTHYMVTINFTEGVYKVYDASGVQKEIRYFKKGVLDVFGQPLNVS